MKWIKTFPLKTRARFMKKLSFLLEAGIPFTQALHFIHEGETGERMKKHINKIIDSIHAGVSITRSFEILPMIVDRRSLSVIESAEFTGTLSKNCVKVADDLEKRLADKGRMVGLLVYPSCIVFFSFALVVVLVVFVFPKILPIVSEGGKMPQATRLLLGFSVFVKDRGFAVVIFLVILVLLCSLMFNFSRRVRKGIEHLCLKIPFLSRLLRLIKTGTLSRMLSLFLQSGHTLVESLAHVGRLETNTVFKEAIEKIMVKVKRGNKFSSSITDTSFLFVKETSQFVALGEESGNLSKTLLHLSLLCDEELKSAERKIFSLVEPALMLFLGGMVGFVALALMSPLYSITSSLSQPSL